jgi:hypothetical protein
MERFACVHAIGCVLALAVACGGPAFTTGEAGDDGGAVSGDAGPDATASEGGAPDGSADAAETGGGSDAGGADVIGAPDVLADAPPTCSGQYACVPAVPAGWAGPLEVYSGAGPAPSCSPLFQLLQDGNDQLDAGPATCGCQCGDPKVACASPTISFFSASSCTPATACASITLAPSTCTPVDERSKCAIASLATYMSSPQATVTDAGCVPQATQTILPPTWGTTGRACASAVAPAQVDCPSGSVCAPRPAQPFAASTCIAETGDVPCPGGGYSDKHLFFTGVADTRGCTACTCGGADNPGCAATIADYPQGQSCVGQRTAYLAPFSCAGVDQPRDFLVTLTSSAGACPPSQSTPTGAATPAKPVTVCCAP